MSEHVMQNVDTEVLQACSKREVILPNPHGPLSSEVPPGAIEAANDRASETTQSSVEARATQPGDHIQNYNRQQLMIGKRASEYGTTAAMKYFAKKYPGEFGSLKETTVRCLKNIYQAELRVSDSKAEDLTELPLPNKCIIFRRTLPDAFILMISSDHQFYLKTVNHAHRDAPLYDLPITCHAWLSAQ